MCLMKKVLLPQRGFGYTTHLKRNFEKKIMIYIVVEVVAIFFVRYDIGMSEYWIYKEGWVLKKQIGTQVLFEKTQVGSGKYHQVLKNLVRDVHWNRYYISNRTSEKNYHFIIFTIFFKRTKATLLYFDEMQNVNVNLLISTCRLTHTAQND